MLVQDTDHHGIGDGHATVPPASLFGRPAMPEPVPPDEPRSPLRQLAWHGFGMMGQLLVYCNQYTSVPMTEARAVLT